MLVLLLWTVHTYTGAEGHTQKEYQRNTVSFFCASVPATFTLVKPSFPLEAIPFRYGLNVLILCLFVLVLYWQLQSGTTTLLVAFQFNILQPVLTFLIDEERFYYLSFFALLLTSSCQLVSFELKVFLVKPDCQLLSGVSYCISIIDQSADRMIVSSP